MSEQLKINIYVEACREIGCTACVERGDIQCPSVQAWLADPDQDILDLYFPRPKAAVETLVAEGVAAVHDRLVNGGYAEGQAREEAKKARYSRGWRR